jgi:hypothetical protein
MQETKSVSMFKIAVFIENAGRRGEWNYVIRTGVASNPRCRIVDDVDSADIILCNDEVSKFFICDPKKRISIDYKDDSHEYSKQKSLLYFKRSTIHKIDGQFHSKLPSMFIPIPYPIKSFYCYNIDDNIKKDIDVSILFACHQGNTHKWRTLVTKCIRDHPKLASLKKQVGPIGPCKSEGRNNYIDGYWKTLRRSKIVVTCSPSSWEGDSRLVEAISSNTLVFSDRLYAEYTHPFRDKVHCIFYDLLKLNDLVDNIVTYLKPENENTRLQIAENGYKHAMEFYKPSDIIDQIIDKYMSTK